MLNLIGWLLCQRLHIAVLVGVPLAHGQFITVLFNLFVTSVHLLPTCILYYVYLMLLAIGPNKVFLIPDSNAFFIRFFTVLMARSACPLLCGYRGLLVTCSMSYNCVNVRNSLQENGGALSETNTLGEL